MYIAIYQNGILVDLLTLDEYLDLPKMLQVVTDVCGSFNFI